MKKTIKYLYECIAVVFISFVGYRAADREFLITSYLNHNVFPVEISEDFIYYFFAWITVAGLIVVNSVHLLFGNIETVGDIESTVTHTRGITVVDELALAACLTFGMFSCLVILEDFSDCLLFEELLTFGAPEGEGYFLVFLDVLVFLIKLLVGSLLIFFVEEVGVVKQAPLLFGRQRERLLYLEQAMTYAFFFILCSAACPFVGFPIAFCFCVLGEAILMRVHFLARKRRADHDHNNFYRNPRMGAGRTDIEFPEDKYLSCLYIMSQIRPTFIVGRFTGHLLVAVESVLVLKGDRYAKEESLREEGYARGYKEGFEHFDRFTKEDVLYLKNSYGIIETDRDQLGYLRVLLWCATTFPEPRRSRIIAIIEKDGRGLGQGYCIYIASYWKGFGDGCEALERLHYDDLFYELRTVLGFTKKWRYRIKGVPLVTTARYTRFWYPVPKKKLTHAEGVLRVRPILKAKWAERIRLIERIRKERKHGHERMRKWLLKQEIDAFLVRALKRRIEQDKEEAIELKRRIWEKREHDRMIEWAEKRRLEKEEEEERLMLEKEEEEERLMLEKEQEQARVMKIQREQELKQRIRLKIERDREIRKQREQTK